MKLTRRQTGQAFAAGIAATVVPLTAKAETEEELVAIGREIEKLKVDYFGVPLRWKQWNARWERQVEMVRAIACASHAPWLADKVVSTTGCGKLKFAYFDEQRRTVGGLFTVPYLADEQELRRLIGKHRPDDFDGPMCGWVPGYES